MTPLTPCLLMWKSNGGVYLKGYLSIQETAKRWGISVRWVNQYILEGRVPGCERFGRSWAVPENAVKPKKQKPGVKKIERTEHPA